MKPHITDKIWIRLAELSQHDVDDTTAARIRARALGALKSRTPSRMQTLAGFIERIWTDFVELPVVGAVVVACLIWLFQGVASGRPSDQGGRPDGAAAMGSHRTTTSALRTRRAARHTSTRR
jgi:hypothetical protein